MRLWLLVLWRWTMTDPEKPADPCPEDCPCHAPPKAAPCPVGWQLLIRLTGENADALVALDNHLSDCVRCQAVHAGAIRPAPTGAKGGM